MWCGGGPVFLLQHITIIILHRGYMMKQYWKHNFNQSYNMLWLAHHVMYWKLISLKSLISGNATYLCDYYWHSIYNMGAVYSEGCCNKHNCSYNQLKLHSSSFTIKQTAQSEFMLEKNQQRDPAFSYTYLLHSLAYTGCVEIKCEKSLCAIELDWRLVAG